MTKLGIFYDKLRYEEKSLYEKAKKIGIDVDLIDSKNIILNTEHLTSNDLNYGDIILQRSISHFRGQILTSCLEMLGFNIINNSKIGEICGNKLLTSLVLKKNNVPTPKSYFSFNFESAFDIINSQDLDSFPLVFKPVIGSWGRGVFPVRNKETGKMIIEMRQENSSPFSNIYYFQELVNRPPRDIRCIVLGEQVVAAIYRYSSSDEWRTNVSRGGKAEMIKITSDIENIAIKASKAVGKGILGVDMMENENEELLVHEINNTVEFRGASAATGIDIAKLIIDYVIGINKK
jgi:[lysine-biosynthesis-protein LysW]--L-2-aminoadipate ligase